MHQSPTVAILHRSLARHPLPIPLQLLTVFQSNWCISNIISEIILTSVSHHEINNQGVAYEREKATMRYLSRGLALT